MEIGLAGAGVAMSDIGLNDRAVIKKLARGPLHRFADWPNADVPMSAIGLYSVWRDDQFIYIGMAGKVTEAKLKNSHEAGKACGLRDRLHSHADGRRSGDKFCVYVADRLVLPTLTPEQVAAIAAGTQSFDSLVRDFIRGNVAYRFVAFERFSRDAQGDACRLERLIRRGETLLRVPLLNPLRVGSPVPPAAGR